MMKKGYKAGGKVAAFKPCKGCPTPAKCKKAGKCLAKAKPKTKAKPKGYMCGGRVHKGKK
jgi:hypothetical protein